MPTSYHTMLDHLLDIAKVRGNAKKDRIAAVPEPEQAFLKMAKLALDPRVSFGVGKKTITQIEKAYPGAGDRECHWHDNAELLGRLIRRELTGNALIDEIGSLKEQISPQSWDLLSRVIISDLRAGFSAKSVNEIWPETIPLFELQLANKFGPRKISQWPTDAELKKDGVRMASEVDRGKETVALKSRTGNEFHTFDILKADIMEMFKTVFGGEGKYLLDGEIMSGEFNKTSGDIHRKDTQIEDAQYMVFELLGENEFWNIDGKQSHGAQRRRQRLEAFFEKAGAVLLECECPPIQGVRVRHPGMQFGRIILIPQFEVDNAAAFEQLFEYFYSRGEEGLIAKDRPKPYERRRWNGYLKRKGKVSEDLPVIGFEPGERDTKYEHILGALVVDFNGVAVNVSSGLSDWQRQDFWDNRDQLIGRLVEVEAHEKTPDGSLRHPRFKRFRDTVVKGVKE